MEIGERIRETRSKKGINQLTLARMAKVSNTYLSDIEVGRTTPSLKTLLKLAKAMDVDASIFLK
jgi:transcriptional regulator with XRE-family HTH domain